MTRANIHFNIHYYSALLIAFSLPFARLTPVFISVMLLNWIIEGDFKSKFKTLFQNKIALAFICFFLMHLVGLTYSENMKSGWFDVQVKLSLLMFPIMLSSRPFSDKNISDILAALILGATYTSLYLLSRSISIYFTSGENTFFYQSFSTLLHPSYFSMYLNVMVAWLLLNIIQNKNYFGKRSNLFSIFLILFFTFIIILLSSKSGIISILLILMSFLSYIIFFKKNYVAGILVILFVAISSLFVYLFAPKVMVRLSALTEAITSKSANNRNDGETTTVRILVWGAANSVIANNFFLGVGNGDSKDELTKEYAKRNMKSALESKLNTHNEFYQVFVGLGLIGLIVFLINLILPFLESLKTHNYIYLLFLLIIIFNFCSESMLETQAGVLFYAFLNSVLCFGKHQKTLSS